MEVEAIMLRDSWSLFTCNLVTPTHPLPYDFVFLKSKTFCSCCSGWLKGQLRDLVTEEYTPSIYKNLKCFFKWIHFLSSLRTYKSSFNYKVIIYKEFGIFLKHFASHFQFNMIMLMGFLVTLIVAPLSWRLLINPPFPS